jgi:hypothetical protein
MRENFVNGSQMHDVVALLEMPPQVCEVGAPGAFFEQSAALEEQLERSEERLVRELVSVLDKQLLEVLSARSLAEFTETREKVFPKYIRAVRALSGTVGNLVSKKVGESAIRGAIVSLDADLRRQEPRFGELLVEQAIFTVWTIGRMRTLAREIGAAGSPPREKRETDMALFSECSANAYWSWFHLDMMVAAMKFGRPLLPDLQETICEGLRATVNAYAIMKEALLLRAPRIEEPPVSDFLWDEEDEQLLASSMRDLNGDLSDNSHNPR